MSFCAMLLDMLRALEGFPRKGNIYGYFEFFRDFDGESRYDIHSVIINDASEVACLIRILCKFFMDDCLLAIHLHLINRINTCGDAHSCGGGAPTCPESNLECFATI